MTFELDFISDKTGLIQIDEPIGISDMVMGLKQKDGGYARDEESIGDADHQLVFYLNRQHEIDKLLYYRHYYGSESNVQLVITFDNLVKKRYQLDFKTSTTNDYDEFKCVGTLATEHQLTAKRASVPVDVFSDKGINEKPITPLVPINLLVKAKPTFLVSEWEDTVEKKYFGGNKTVANFASKQDSYGVRKSYTPFKVMGFINDMINAPLIEFADNARNVTVEIEIKSSVTSETTKTSLRVAYQVGSKLDLNVPNVIDDTNIYTSIGGYSFLDSKKVLKFPFINRGQKLWVFQVIGTLATTAGSLHIVDYTIHSYRVKVTAELISYNTVTPAFRLIDVLRHQVKSISGNSLIAKDFDEKSKYYDTFIFNGNLARRKNVFNLSFEELMESVATESNSDYQIEDNGNISIYHEKDFYQDKEIAFFDNTQFDSLELDFNQKFLINTFGFEYEKFQSKKEKDEANSADSIHGKTKWYLQSEHSINKKEVKVPWVRDAFQIDTMLRKAIEITKDTASQDDTTLIAIDCVPLIYDIRLKETANLSHNYDGNIGKLVLRNEGEFNFIILGLEVGAGFDILAPDQNSGNFIIHQVKGNEVVLTRTAGGNINTSTDGIRNTSFEYIIKKGNVTYVNRTTEGISNITGLNASDSYSNIRFSAKSNILNYYSSYLATANMYNQGKTVKNSEYLNNPNAQFEIDNILINEGSEFVPKTAFLSQNLFKNVTFANVHYDDYIELQNRLKKECGYIRFIDANNVVRRIYPKEMKYFKGKNELNFLEAEEKLESKFLNIDSSNPLKYVVNGTIHVTKIIYEKENERIFLYDDSNYRLFNGHYWFNISVNGALSATESDLITLLETMK